MSARLSRRRLLAGLAAAALVPAAARAAAPAVRVATLDWALLETLLAIGVTPVAAAELVLYRQVVVEPELPAAVADLGLRGTPNYEALRLLRPDLIFGSNYTSWADPKLRLIAPVENISIYGPGARPYAAAEAATLAVGARTGRTGAAEALVAGARARLAALKARLAGGDGRPVLVINLGDDRHFRVFGADSMFGEVLERLGLANAWTAGTRYSATAPMGLEVLAQIGEAWIAVLPPVPAPARKMLAGGGFWHALPNVRAGRVVELAPVDPFGALPAGLRFARLLAEALPFAGKAGSLG
ncbi:ABC transporter substrate-binding protein [Azorhizobium doebereinerae]|uniref:ABC transporter substrate-binding protein n=1 Tax=Azorhizobium doebereinerae TaxID=281091 RepID=UPI00040961BB|nr:ABC transporter substrate-binding protein [Azorhizobium doebereinerae]